MSQSSLALGSDHAGLHLKNHLLNWLQSQGYTVKDYGVYSAESMDYPDIAIRVANAVAAKEYTRGILVCGSGIGVAIAANKVSGIRAARCTDPLSARLSREHNDANILTLGDRLTTPMVAENIVDTWLNTAFEGGRHQRRVDKLDTI